MDNYSKQYFQHDKATIINYGKLFIDSEGGCNWEKLWIGSTKSLSRPSWLHFYYDLYTNKFQESIDNLLNYEIGAYQREQIIHDTKDLVEILKTTETTNPQNPASKTYVSIELAALEKFKEAIEYLFENYILENFPWGEGERQDIVIIKLINGQFKEILLEGYYSIINYYENEDQQKIRELEKQIQDFKNTIQILKEDTKLNESRLNELKNQKNEIQSKSNQLKVQQRTDKKSIKELTKEIQKLRQENDVVYSLEDDLSDSTHNDLFALILLNELDLLDSKVWDNAESIDDVANVLYNLLKISKKLKLTAKSIVKYRGIILYPHTDHKRYEGWQKTYNKRVTEIMNKYLPKKEIKLIKPIKLK
ncbi:hypothetical protein [Albibacterium bauzanense]|uniref:Uncharacterized protein n=1 Tax=Albibacterium bauzanense TaxID=653929 RepID=A0A4R1LWQ5_9SPHI|nr:hypothetical protein [Albibacterium bauzanense]TCK82894.1 hypothetical protein C8N28_1480 [Albibacterium bauzanense]